MKKLNCSNSTQKSIMKNQNGKSVAKTNYFNNPLELINKKPNGSQMANNGYGFYMYPTYVMEYANVVLTDRERRLYYAISGQAERDSKGKKCKWTLQHYCQIANIKSNHYSEVLEGLCKKGFIEHIKFESIKVLYPIGGDVYIEPNGELVEKHSDLEEEEENEQNSNFPNEENESSKTINIDYCFGNKFSQGYANNKEIDNNKLNKEEEKLIYPNVEAEMERQETEEQRREKLMKELQALI